MSFFFLTEVIKFEETLQLYECVLCTAVENFTHHRKAATYTSERKKRRGGGREGSRGREEIVTAKENLNKIHLKENLNKTHLNVSARK